MGRMGRVPIATVPRKRLPYNTQEGKFITFLNDLMPNHRNIGRLGVATVSYTHLDVYKRQVIRHELVARIVEAYDAAAAHKRERPE